MDEEVHVYEKGCLCESFPWSIVKDYLGLSCEDTVCEHCVEIDKKNQSYVEMFGGRQWVCPFVVTAQNEGGYNSTSVCLYCILKAAKELGVQ